MKSALARAAEVIFRRKIWGWVGRILLIALTVTIIVLVLTNDFLSERFWIIYFMLALTCFFNLALVFVIMISDDIAVNGKDSTNPLMFHSLAILAFLALWGLMILNPLPVKSAFLDWLVGLMKIDVVILYVIIFVDGIYLYRGRTRNQVIAQE
ncbi:MAG: hypothetical protein UV05_C0014G0006 [candidate division CPR1 bacterium GW2011_GWA2_42_17]|uniref:Uncharacterized protein n=1 Tax=candidate division CPR1 bacterium GW2011_GWA2_42_17 TaxID=1618341 RepID=A0A0G1BCB6_9BACT|nr:MAG: hypothetical protein UV05_C0014G0006 [candidate division CPR1 bacterium GW2011_GWA2_42_17]